MKNYSYSNKYKESLSTQPKKSINRNSAFSVINKAKVIVEKSLVKKDKKNKEEIKELSQMIFNNLLKLKIPYEKQCFMIEQKRLEMVKNLWDLKNLPYQSDNDLVDIISTVISDNKPNYFLNCGHVLLNFNPGPGPNDTSKESSFQKVGSSYLNLNSWLSDNITKDMKFIKNYSKYSKENPETPHFFSYIKKVYDIMFKEKKSQSIVMKGEVGSGKTFSLIHALEALCYFSQINSNELIPKLKENSKKVEIQQESKNSELKKQSFKNKIDDDIKITKQIKDLGDENNKIKYSPINVFDVIHRSFQLLHIVSSIFRNENMESTCSGMTLKVGFNSLTGKLTSFDIEGQILDSTLPFSQNGRTLSILHSIITGANESVKKSIFLPENVPYNSNFLKKFSSQFDANTQEKFKLCDYEVYTRFYSLLKQFKFSKTEISDIYKIISFILQSNDLNIGKRESKEKNVVKVEENEKTEKFKSSMFVKDSVSAEYEYSLLSNHTTKNISSCLDIKENEFISAFGIHNNIEDIKTSIISLMKYGYNQLFDFILLKLKEYLKVYFYCVNTGENISDYYYKSEVEKSHHVLEALKQAIANRTELKVNDRCFPFSDLELLTGATQRKMSLNTSKRNTIDSNQSISGISINNKEKILKKLEKLELSEYSLLKESVHLSELKIDHSQYKGINLKNSPKKHKISNSNIRDKSNDKNNTEIYKDEELFLYFIDSPGEIKDQTLGGLCSNLFNECVNLYSTSQFHRLTEVLLKDGISFSKATKMDCYDICHQILNPQGLFNFMHLPNEENLIQMIINSNAIIQENSIIQNINEVSNFNNQSDLRKLGTLQSYQTKYLKSSIIKAIDDLILCNFNSFLKLNKLKNSKAIEWACLQEQFSKQIETKFTLNYTYNSVSYDFKSLSLETRTIVVKKNIPAIFSISKNSVCYYLNEHDFGLKRKINNKLYHTFKFERNSFFNYYLSKINKVFNEVSKIEHPFIIYSVHSINSSQDYFNFELENVKSQLEELKIEKQTKQNLNYTFRPDIKKEKSLIKVNTNRYSVHLLNQEKIDEQSEKSNKVTTKANIVTVNSNKSNKVVTNNNNNASKKSVLSQNKQILTTKRTSNSNGRTSTVNKVILQKNLELWVQEYKEKLEKEYLNRTKKLFSKSIVGKILHWNWFGFQTCISYKCFVGMFYDDFESAKNTLFSYSAGYAKNLRDINLPLLSYKDKTEFMLSILLNESNYVMGDKYVWMKLNSLKIIYRSLNSLKLSSNRKKTIMAFTKQRSYIDHQIGSLAPIIQSESTTQLIKKNSLKSFNHSKSISMTKIPKYNSEYEDSYETSWLYLNSILLPIKRISCPVNYVVFSGIIRAANEEIVNSSKQLIRRSSTQNNIHDQISGANKYDNSKITQKLIQNYFYINELFMKSDFNLNSILSINPLKYSNYSSMKEYINRIPILSESTLPTENENIDDKNATSFNYREIVKRKAEFLLKLKNAKVTNDTKELDFKDPLKKYNIVEPTKQNLHIIKSMFDFHKQGKFAMFDYQDYIATVIYLQKIVRGFIMRTKYSSLKYGLACIVKIQTFVRGYKKRKLFDKFRFVLKKVMKLQKCYKKRFISKEKSVIKVQCLIRIFLARKKLKKHYEKKLDKILNYLEETGQIKDKNDPKVIKNLNKYSYPQDLEIEYTGMTEEENNIEKELENISTLKKSKANITGTKKLIKQGKQYQQNLDLIKKLENANQDQIIQVLMDDMKEELKSKVIEKGVFSNVEASALGYTNKKPRNKIEDKLIKFGKDLKIKNAQNILEKETNQFSDKYTFIPDIKYKRKSFNNPNLPSSDFLERVEIYKEKHEIALQKAQINYKEDNEEEPTFAPEIGKSSRSLKRNVSDLLNWKEKKEKKLTVKKMKKELDQQNFDNDQMKNIENNNIYKNFTKLPDFGEKIEVKEVSKLQNPNFRGHVYPTKKEDNKYVNLGKKYDEILREKTKKAEQINDEIIENDEIVENDESQKDSNFDAVDENEFDLWPKFK